MYLIGNKRFCQGSRSPALARSSLYLSKFYVLQVADDHQEKAGEEATGMALPRVLSAGRRAFGRTSSTEDVEAAMAAASNSAEQQESDSLLTAEKLTEEVLSFPTNCPECNAPAATNMKVTSE